MKTRENKNLPADEDPKEIASEKSQILIRYFIVVVLFIVVVIGISVSIFKIAFTEKEKWEKVAERQKRPDQKVKPERGNIYSSDGKLMVTNVPRYYLYMDFRAEGFPQDSFRHAKSNGLDSLAICLAGKLGNRSVKGYKEHLMRGLNQKSREYPVYEGRVTYADLKAIKQFPFIRLGRNKSGFYAKEMVQRQKFYGSLASRTLGDIYNEIETGDLPKGKNGLELRYDSLMRGRFGMKSTIRVGRNWTDVIDEEPTTGMDIVTTIDIQVQDFTENALVDKLREIDAESGTAIVMEVRTGEIKAISNIERVRPGVYTETKTRNYAVADQIEPGSTMKIASIMIALDDKVCKPDDVVETGNGKYRYADHDIIDHNADRGGYHRITVEQAIWYSSNIGVAKTILKGYERQPEKFIEGLHRVGMDADLNIEIPGAGHARIRTPEDARWSRLSLPWMSFGYEVQVPPIQMLTFYNAIANNGKMIRPVFVKEVRENGKTVERYSTETVRSSICSRETLRIIREMMVNVVEKGTGAAVHSNAVPIAGKTGTARIATGGSYQSHQVSFCGYFPVDDPQYSCIVVIRRPRIGYPSGGTMSGGVFKTIAEKIYADRTKIEVRSMERDSTAVRLPVVKNGDAKALEYILDELDIKTRPRHVKAGYAAGERQTENNLIELKELTVREGLVPHVVGMGAKDAVYALENAGLRVNLSGKGKVVSQSLPPGQRAVKGQTVGIVLKN
ncbi:MAG: transpeptidase family protein [Tannerella sp.]|jgi:cell division protein FtsI (penicillin-binding protein 3)|nr:transpeptidase family protein [Tannerella sp.]